MKKTLLFSLTFALLLSCLFPVAGYAEGEAQPVSTAAEFEAMSPTGSYYLANDIDFGGKVYANYILASFSGTLDGMGHTVFNFSIGENTAAGINGGVFAQVGTEGNTTIRNLNIGKDGQPVQAKPKCAGHGTGFGVLAGIQPNATYLLTVDHVNIYADLTVGYTAYRLYVGGFAASVQNAVFSNCNMYGSVTGWTGNTWINTGGIVGSLTGTGGSFTNCANFADVTVYQSQTVRGAGILGYAGTGAALSMIDCVNFGDIDLTPENFEGRRNVWYGTLAGILGNTDGTGGSVKHCMNFGSITNRALVEANKLVGSAGIVGWNGKANAYTGCVNYGSLSAESGRVGAVCMQDGAVGNTEDIGSTFTGNLDKTGSLSGSAAAELNTYGVQNSKPVSDLFNVRFVATLDSLNYTAAGFEITAYWQGADGTLQTKDFRVDCRKVYREITGKAENGIDFSRTAQELGGEYVYALSILHAPAAADMGNVTFVCRSFAETTDGTAYGNALACAYRAGEFLFCSAVK